MADGKIKKALKDLSLPLKPSAMKAALMVADMVRKAPATGAAGMGAVRKQLGQRYEEKAVVWEGGVVPPLIALLPVAKDKPMIEAISLCIYHVINNCPDNVALAADAGAAKNLVDLCKDKSLIVQQYACAALAILATNGTETRQAVIAAGGMKQLTVVASALDTEDVIGKQGINKQIPYKPWQRQEAAATALRTLSDEASAKEVAGEVGTIKQLVVLLGGEGEVKTKEECAHSVFLLVSEPKNRRLVIDCGGLPPLVRVLTESSSEHARTMAAGALKEIARERPLRVPVRKAGAMPPLVQLCRDGKGALAHEQATGALRELSNELECKCIIRELGAAKDVAALLTSSQDPNVLENALGMLGFMCIIGVQDPASPVVSLSPTTFESLQQDLFDHSVVAPIVSLTRNPEESVHNMAVRALAAACLQHPGNSAKAASASASQSLVALLQSKTHHVVANTIHALLSVCRSYEPNRREAARLGASAALVVLKNESESELVRDLASDLLSVLGVLPSKDCTASSLLLTHIIIGEAYSKQQAAPVVDEVGLLLKATKECREACKGLASKQNMPMLLRLAMNDSLTYVPGGGGGGANGSVVLEEEMGRGENQGLQGVVSQLRGIKESYPLVSWADIIQMSAAEAITACLGVEGPKMLFGRQDANVAAAEGMLPTFVRPEGDGGGEGEGEGGEEGEGDGKGELEKSMERVGLSLEEMAVMCASMGLGWAKAAKAEGGEGGEGGEEAAPSGEDEGGQGNNAGEGGGEENWALDCGYFRGVQETLKARKAALKAVDAEEEGAEAPPPLTPDAAMLSEKRFDAIVKRYSEDQGGLTADFVELFKKLSEVGSVFDARAPQGFYVG